MSLYPVVDSFIEQLTISHLVNPDIRRVIGSSGIKRVCDPLKLFRSIFSEPSIFNDIFSNDDIQISGPGITEYMFRGEVSICKPRYPSIVVRTQRQGMLDIHNYYMKYESTINNEPDRPRSTYLLRSDLYMTVVYDKDRGDPVSHDNSIFSRDNVKISLLTFLPKEHSIGPLENIEFGIPRAIPIRIELRIEAVLYIDRIKNNCAYRLIPGTTGYESDKKGKNDTALCRTIVILPDGRINDHTHIRV